MGVWWRVGNTKLLKPKKHKTFEFIDMQIIIYISLLVGVWWRVGNTKLLKPKKHKTFEFIDMQIIIYIRNHSGVFLEIVCFWRSSAFGDRLLLEVVVSVDTTVV